MNIKFFTINAVPSLILVSLLIKTHAQSISDSVNGFSVELLKTLVQEFGSSENIALSPYTVWTLLAIINEGAGGHTAEELNRALRIRSKDKFRADFKSFSNGLTGNGPGVDLDVSNAIFTTKDQNLKTQFAELARKFYDVEILPTNFSNSNQAVQSINKYVSQKTRNRIQNFISSEDIRDAQIFITSALFFKGTWMMPFNRSETIKGYTFNDESGKKLGEVEMMFQRSFFPYTKLEEFNSFAVEVPYGDGTKMSMILVLPNKGQTLATVLAKMSNRFSVVIDKLNQAAKEYEGEDVDLFLPKFTIKSDVTLNRVLDKMGVRDVFNMAKADLLGMFPHYLYVSRLIQRAEIEVNEEGTVASAAAGASVANKSPPPRFLANRPFLYFIVDKPRKTIVFAGRVSSP